MNPLYSLWIESLARRDQAMVFITVTALAGIGAWLALRDWSRVRRPFVYLAVGLYYTSLLLVALLWKP